MSVSQLQKKSAHRLGLFSVVSDKQYGFPPGLFLEIRNHLAFCFLVQAFKRLVGKENIKMCIRDRSWGAQGEFFCAPFLSIKGECSRTKCIKIEIIHF